MSTVYANFFTPQTISILFSLYEMNKQLQQIEADNNLLKFLIKKILDVTNQSSIVETNDHFMNQMFQMTKDNKFLQRYQEALSQVNCFNDFYREISNILKNLRSMRNSKLQQSNLIDFLVRRLYIYFQKLDFKEIVKIYDNFVAYYKGQPKKLKQHEFMLTKSIEEVKFNMENYPINKNPQQLDRLIEKLQKEDHTFKTSYLKGLMRAQQNIPSESIHSIHRYFDKSLGNLFQQKVESIGSSNKINHCILSIAYASLKMGHLDQCLQSISEGLRISQNNSDQQSINNCIIYLYKIAQRLGKFRQQILLAEHAITHSLNQNNLMLMLYSCLNYSYYERNYNCKDSSITLLKTRQINWTDALHFAKKKIYSHFENNCKNIFHSHRSLLIPTFVHKIAILIHLPSLKNLLLNSYYQREQLTQLNIYKEYQEEDELEQEIKRGRLLMKMGAKKLLYVCLNKLAKIEKNPQQHIKLGIFENEVIMREGNLVRAYEKAEQLLEYCNNHGYTKHEYVTQMLLICKILHENELYYDALLKAQETLILCQKHNLKTDKMVCLIAKADVLLKLNQIMEPISIIKEIEEMGQTTALNSSALIYFYEVKILLNQKVKAMLNQNNSDATQEFKTIHHNIQDCFIKIIGELEKQVNFVDCLMWIQKMQKYQKAVEYGHKILKILKQSELETSNDEKLGKKIIKKLIQLCDFRY